MKETILKKTGEIFLKFGFKSVTMDDIANDLGISKKTLYKYFKNKEDLVDQAVVYAHEECLCAMDKVCSLNYNAIHENFEVKNVFKDLMNNSDQSPIYQLEKYYPKTFEKVMKKEFLMFQDCISKNIEKGMREGLYRNNINISIVTRFYFALIMAIHNSPFFTYNKNTINKLETEALEFHTRAIATKKGITELEKQLADLNTI
jgi:AcrR family transcriptional regulator